MKKIPPPLGKMQKIRRGEPIEECGLVFYPILMQNYEEFAVCKDALALRMSAFPARLACMDYLSAIFTADTDEKYASLKIGAFGKAIRMLLLSLRIEATEETLSKMLYFRQEDGKIALAKLAVVQNGKTVEIPPSVFSSRIRPIICQQNGIELPDENVNLELLRAYEEKKKLQGENIPLKQDVDDLIATVAYLSHVQEREIYDWTVLAFERRKRAIEREKLFTIYKSAEMSGSVSFPKGNPVPSLFFDLEDETLGTRSLQEVGKSFGNAAQSGELPPNLKN